MLQIVLIGLQLFLLFLTSRKMSQSLYLLFYRLFRSKRLAVYLLALVFLPGVIIHELAHWGMAKALLVHTGRVNLFPRAENTSVKLGSVEVAKVDPIRELLIGVAPVIIGISLLVGLALFLGEVIRYFEDLGLSIYLIFPLLGYVLFVITNTMFSSKKDVEGALVLVIMVAVLAGTFLVVGWADEVIRFVSATLQVPAVEKSLQLISNSLYIPLGINLGLGGLFFVIHRR